MGKYTKTDCIELLKAAQRKREESGQKGYVCRSDFTTEEVVAVKAFLGPWPRALEAAGIKPPREVSRKDLNRLRRARAKRARRLEAREISVKIPEEKKS
ncbi:MAG: hypothetical protein IJV00_01935 [Clostridia bacterium]|nr:hypothetical protein [Clostridia bacterium]